ncbi:MAG: DUF4340 domain-containing protein [Myxococcota bacterium]|nr:DUF4340 domain-containing protein [Myxococcota bacterium]
MKAFRGTILALIVLALVAGVVFMLKPPAVDVGVEGDGERLFTFEKHELVRIEVTQPGKEPVALIEEDAQWLIDGTDKVASRSMVNRAKHQIHDLTSRATLEDAADVELYGLGALSTKVILTLRDGTELKFDVGHPNPTNVSYYIQRQGDAFAYTVKKSASDFWLLLLTDPKLARETRFATFDSKDAAGIVATLAGDESQLLELVLVGEQTWEMRKPIEMVANTDRVKRLLGRVSALKARDIIDVPAEQLEAKKAEFGLDNPRADITIQFGSREPFHVLVGDDAPTDNRLEEMAYMWLESEPDTVYIARRGMLEEFGKDPSELRNRRVVEMKADDVVAVDVELALEADDDLEGSAGVRYLAEQWVWEDGVPVNGSTPDRATRSLAELEVDVFIDDAPEDLSEYGLTPPVARAVLTDRDENTRVVLIGIEGEPLVDSEGRERPRRFVSIEGDPSVYLVSDQSIKTVKDMVRERNRKAEKDAARALNLEQIPSEAIPDDEEQP